MTWLLYTIYRTIVNGSEIKLSGTFLRFVDSVANKTGHEQNWNYNPQVFHKACLRCVNHVKKKKNWRATMVFGWSFLVWKRISLKSY
ncbi:MAG: hypothetical protein DRP65_08650 [Planctomycetota bacterium]|nr:MAG: hypothetical protein DRP65_08650 [Planctomycetota bacterium]